MAGIKKLKADPSHLNNFMSSDVASGNNPAGSGTSKGTVYVSWPYNPATSDDLINPKQNPVVPKRLVDGNELNTGLTG